MICILLSNEGKDFKVLDPDTKEDLTDQYECNLMVIQTADGKWRTGFHIGVECDETVSAGLEASQNG